MKKRLLFIASIALQFTLEAQILNQSTHEFAIGDTYSYVEYDTVALVPRQEGQNQTWDFSSVTTSPVGNSTITFSDATGSGNANATMKETDGTDVLLYSTDANGIYIEEAENSLGRFVFDQTKLKTRSWPLQYTNAMAAGGTGTFYSSNQLAPLPMSLSGSASYGCNGKGTLIGPDGKQFDNVLMVIENLDFQSSGDQGAVMVTGRLTLKSYLFYVEGTKQPLLSFIKTTSSQLGFQGGPGGSIVFNNSTLDYKIHYSPDFMTTGSGSLGIDELENSVSVYPNPATSELNISFLQPTEFKVFNTQGQEVGQSKEVALFHQLDVNNYEAGIYFLQANGSYTKFVVKK